ncbi:sensor histidine kinase [Rhizohabitans arisaemae]|uniref:sensor histidine kinase n=1 Tax=Rhizohabitans arisaemae TaxID=2720610 RepID=UPI0024B127C6|nr:sensor histidine kinase [Rhizohabitans arisaemae]
MNRLPRWRRLGQAERWDLWTRAGLCGAYVLEPVAAAAMIGSAVDTPARWAILTYLCLHSAGCGLLVHAGIGHHLGNRPRPVRLIAATSGLTVVGVVLAVAAYPDAQPGHPDGPASALTVILATAFAGAVAVAVPFPATVLVWAAAAAGKFAVSRVEGAPLSIAVPAALGLLGLAATWSFIYRSSLWSLKVVWEMEHSRKAHARLAVAEERLRFARDLHDVIGRNLAVVALKSELAARLIERGRPGAAEEMREVREIAQESLAEMRAVVRGYRATDLDTELAGATSVLASAGVRCRVTGDTHGLSPELQSTLGWVVREGTTNVLRHSEARTCTVSLHRSASGGVGRLTLTMENDGVTGPEDSGGLHAIGSGFSGVAERLAPLGGRVVARREPPDRFRLIAELPLPVTTSPGDPANAGLSSPREDSG